MSVQVNDYVIYKDQRFVLIDVEKNKQMICCADFFKEPVFTVFNSACHRGYTAKYTIKDGILYGIRYAEVGDGERLASEEMPLNFTGSCIIAAGVENGKWVYADDLFDYLDYKEAYELHFTNGKIDEERNLSVAILEMQEIRKKEASLNNMREILEEVSRKHLKYDYDDRSYKWRPSCANVLPRGSKVRLKSGEIAYIGHAEAGACIGEIAFYFADSVQKNGKLKWRFVYPDEIAELIE